jgi:SAM-dependent methyltransferase
LAARGGRNVTHTIELDGHSLVTPESIADEVCDNFDAVSEGFDDRVAAAKGQLLPHLDGAAEAFRNGAPTHDIGRDVTLWLHEIRNSVEIDVWRTLIPFVQSHPVAGFFMQDPLTKWSFDRPRGYSGDAHLLDLIYRHEKIAGQVAAASELGREVYEFTSHAPSSYANCDRRDILARHVDETAARVGQDAEIMSFAAGHMREAEVSKAHAERKLGRWVAVDQDPLSIAEIEASYAGTPVQAVTGSVRDLLARKLDLGTFDLVYASGLYDYLNDKVAVKLTQRLLQLVKPGGAFLFANYSHPIIVDGYLETFMNWTLLLRSEDDIRRIIGESADESEWTPDVFFGENRNIVYGLLTRKL